MPEYTKGEWTRFMRLIHDKDKRVIAEVVDGSYEEKEANAQLIASAPKLYEALREMLNIFDRQLPPSSIGRAACDIALEALAQAEVK